MRPVIQRARFRPCRLGFSVVEWAKVEDRTTGRSFTYGEAELTLSRVLQADAPVL